MGLILEDGEHLLDLFNKLPVKAQQVFMAAVASGLYDEKSIYMNALGWMATLGEFQYKDCESPIEVMFAFCYDIGICSMGFPYFEYFSLYPQKPITANGKTYRADFVVDTSEHFADKTEHIVNVIFECDGHDFHEKTKEQVIKCNNRDFDLKMAGYEVIHFSGSEIYRDPLGCAKKAIDYVLQKAGKVYGDV